MRKACRPPRGRNFTESIIEIPMPDPRLFVCALQPFLDSVQMTIDGVKAYRKVAQVEFGKWWKMDPSSGMVQTPGY